METQQTIRQQLRMYRQAALKWAFEGRLTEKWQKDNLSISEITTELSRIRVSTIFDVVDGTETYLNIAKDWVWVSFGDLFQIEVGATPSRIQPDYWNGNINWVSSGEVKFKRADNNRRRHRIPSVGLQQTRSHRGREPC